MGERSYRAAWIVLFGIALILRLSLLGRQGLWVDEVFSLAMATGHSIEQDPAISRPELGDFVEPRAAVPSAVLRRYLQHDSPPAGPYRVLRGVFISDTSPPLYYLLLWAWTLAVGTSDAALRLFSAICSLAALPLLRSMAREIAGERAALAACAFYAVVPVALEAGIEGRMYGLTILLGTLLAWTSLALARRGFQPRLALLWIATAAGGFLTHYFFAFVWFACAVWLLLAPGRLDRRTIPLMSAAMALLIAPWFLRMPEILGHWRVAKGWLDGLPPLPRVFVAPLDLAAGLFSVSETLGERLAKREPLLAILVGLGLTAVAAVRLLLRSGRSRGGDWGPRALPGLWLAASCLGPLVFDLLCRSRSEIISRYAWPALPAAALLVGMLGARLAARPRYVLAALVLLAWLPAYWRLFRPVSRHGDSFRETAAVLRQWARPRDVVIVHSIPSGVLGLARYLGEGPAVASWVGQLGRRRVPADTELITTGERRVALVEVHELQAPAPEEGWLRVNARLVDAQELRDARLLFFDLESGRAGSTRMAKGPDAELERAPLLRVTTGRAILSR
ncbi:MAG TPA: glycosyltransferase family 39 protein [Thermoanaerobaculia bacterium]|jgi:4-amino-4-deoxy-L-arabinose transferase-like glycosyltransferase|nr:glycosyltransferase family 39 protein [Thermoanaerobaculia bacterium]